MLSGREGSGSEESFRREDGWRMSRDLRLAPV